jgi:hypothetical protein
MSFHIVGFKKPGGTKQSEPKQVTLIKSVYQNRHNDKFFLNPRNKNMIRYILNFLTREDKTIIKTLSKVIMFSVILEVQPFNVAEITKIKHAWYSVMKTYPNFETFLKNILTNEDFKDRMFYNYRILFKNWEIFLTQYFPRWTYNFYFKRTKFPAISLNNSLLPQTEIGRTLLYNTLPYIKHLIVWKMDMESNFSPNESSDNPFENCLKRMSFMALNSLHWSNVLLDKKLQETLVHLVLPQCVNVQKLILEGLDLDDDVTEKLVEDLHKMTKLDTVSLGRNPNITHGGVIGAYIGSNPIELETLVLDEWSFNEGGLVSICNGLKSNKNLNDISLSKIDVSADSLVTFILSLKGNQSLRSINLSHTKSSSKLLKEIVNMVPTTKLDEVILTDCEGVSKSDIEKAIKNNKSNTRIIF